MQSYDYDTHTFVCLHMSVEAVTDEWGTQWYDANGELHRDGDLPAVVAVSRYGYGYQEWYQHGRLHRSDDLPAVVGTVRGLEWYKHGERHRDGDLPAVVGADGSKCWYKHGKKHRDGDLPAVEHDGTQCWYQHGRCHRSYDLPAVVFADGRQEWWVDGRFLGALGRARTRRWSPLRAAFVGAVVC
jgi:hypothetical protein